MRKTVAALLVAALLAILPIGRAAATNVDLGAVVTLTAQGAGTVTGTPSVVNDQWRGAICTWNQASHTGTPSSTFSIQFLDTASNSWVTLLTSAAQTADTTPATLSVYPGITAAANVSVSQVLPRRWRVSTTVGGTTPGVTGTIGCTLIN